ncbi:MAG: L,D-transpeptidase catalytic domain-containing protein [Candidatus Tokpelaia hoelldobleri]|uniref:L,D-transpeptidase catalytic domain-containing protein n=1 Tax=Candidatus Tokpelaia hoelldobleri TaxID=1902579 RepID=A0A1U9JWM3_9HYPH|nr:MAG: L,D-transpeptidase catalytic domain-containing protein [Candidatus Tokpelaia hoelldoblerii]
MRKNRSFFTTVVVRPAPGNKTRGILQAGPLRLPCAIGRGGMSAHKREGDGATPIGSMQIISGFRKPFACPLPPCRVKLHRTRAADGWCDDPHASNYNRPVRLPCPANAETMRREDELYDIGFVLDWNIRPRSKNRGSAIFFHLAKPGYPPTQGCIALSRRDMERLLPHLAPRTRLVIRR